MLRLAGLGPWLALAGFVWPVSASLSLTSGSLGRAYDLYWWIIRNYHVIEPAILEETVLTLRHGIAVLTSGSLLVISQAWASGYVLGSLITPYRVDSGSAPLLLFPVCRIPASAKAAPRHQRRAVHTGSRSDDAAVDRTGVPGAASCHLGHVPGNSSVDEPASAAIALGSRNRHCVGDPEMAFVAF